MILVFLFLSVAAGSCEADNCSVEELQLLQLHKQEGSPYCPDTPPRGASKGSGDSYMAYWLKLLRENLDWFGREAEWKEIGVIERYHEQKRERERAVGNRTSSLFQEKREQDWFPDLSCNMSDSACKLGDLSSSDYTMVYPGGDSTCMWGTPYGFLVRPGAPDKLMIYFQGGGGCFGPGKAAQMCTQNLTFGAPSGDGKKPAGILNTCNEDNPFKGYTLVHAMYCSGDVYAGNASIAAAADWPRPDWAVAKEPQIRGYNNMRATLDWVKANFGTVSKLLVSGDSAGAMGAQIWAKTILKELNYDYAAVVPDSYVGAFPARPFGKMIFDYQYCELPLLQNAELTQVCLDGNIGIMKIFNDTLNVFATVPKIQFGMISSKYDLVQMMFYDAVTWTFAESVTDYLQILNPLFPSGQNTFYGYLNDIVKEYVKNLNFDMFWIDANMHTYTELDLVYTASTVSFDSVRGPQPPLIEWLKTYTEPGQNAGQQCDGDSQKQLPFYNKWPTCHTKLRIPFADSVLIADCTNTYCSEVIQ